MSDQEQFLDVIDRDEAERRFRSALNLQPLGTERLAVRESLGRILAVDVLAQVDVPSFDRSNFDGYAVQAADTFGANEMAPKSIQLSQQSIEAGVEPQGVLQPGQAMTIATGGMLPRGADAVLMVEYAEERSGLVFVRRAVTPGFGIAFAGTDIAIGETVLRAGTLLTSRETGVLAAIGNEFVEVWRQPRVTIISTGNEIISPGAAMRPAAVYDSNSQVLADAVREQGGIPILGGIIRDNADELRTALHKAIGDSDVVLLSGGTSKGKGDLCYRVVAEWKDPGVVVHGVALKPGKPICGNTSWLSNFSNLYVSRVCSPYPPIVGRTKTGIPRDSDRIDGMQDEFRNRADGILAGGTDQNRQGTHCVSDGQRLRLSDRIQSSGRLCHDSATHGNRGCGRAGSSAVNRSRFGARRFDRDRESLRST